MNNAERWTHITSIEMVVFVAGEASNTSRAHSTI